MVALAGARMVRDYRLRIGSASGDGFGVFGRGSGAVTAGTGRFCVVGAGVGCTGGRTGATGATGRTGVGCV